MWQLDAAPEPHHRCLGRKREALHNTFAALKEALWWTRCAHPFRSFQLWCFSFYSPLPVAGYTVLTAPSIRSTVSKVRPGGSVEHAVAACPGTAAGWHLGGCGSCAVHCYLHARSSVDVEADTRESFRRKVGVCRHLHAKQGLREAKPKKRKRMPQPDEPDCAQPGMLLVGGSDAPAKWFVP